MNSTIVINDLETNRHSVSMLDADDFGLVEQQWHREDKILVDMQSNVFFQGRTRWCDLDPTHYRLMILNNMTLVAALTDAERNNVEHRTMASLHFLLAGLIFCLQQRTESMIEFVRINRLNAMEAVFDYSASLNIHVDQPKPPPDFRVVVDNE